MKRFSLVTEADARVLDEGSTIVLERGGHVTPLAADTLRDRRVAVVREDGVDVDQDALRPAHPIRSVAIGNDHTGVPMKQHLVAILRSRGVQVLDKGTNATQPVDYPDIAGAVAVDVAQKVVDAGIVIDGAGLGSTIAANKVAGVRAAMCTTPLLARYAREHNGANVLALGASLVDADAARAILETFLETPMTEARYIRRLQKVAALERRPPGAR
ncbi:MAG: RpiB/LacA/LacB family sugar-phosphate isomerase [Vicinamibacterales bacterium]